MEMLIFTEVPAVTIGGCTFQNTPIIWQHDDTPLISLVPRVKAGFTTSIPIYTKDGYYVAKVVGSRIVPGPYANRFKVELRKEARRTICELDGKTVFEIVREEAAALKTAAELYAPNGCFIAVNATELPGLVTSPDGTSLTIKGITLVGVTLQARVGIWTTSDGTVRVACS